MFKHGDFRSIACCDMERDVVKPAHLSGEHLLLDLMSVPRELVAVRVMESTPVIVGDEVRYRLHLKKIS